MEDALSRVLLTCNGSMRGGKKLDFKSVTDRAVALCQASGHAVRSYESE